ncbi:MAG: hypothetical protein QOF66_4390, partial [Mycobacterium sp.]|nr:hypothetical protein [Mycobacterium sp.]
MASASCSPATQTRFPMMMRTATMPTTMRGVQVCAAFWCVIRTLPSFWTETVPRRDVVGRYRPGMNPIFAPIHGYRMLSTSSRFADASSVAAIPVGGRPATTPASMFDLGLAVQVQADKFEIQSVDALAQLCRSNRTSCP